MNSQTHIGGEEAGDAHDRRSQRAARALGEDIDRLLPGLQYGTRCAHGTAPAARTARPPTG